VWLQRTGGRDQNVLCELEKGDGQRSQQPKGKREEGGKEGKNGKKEKERRRMKRTPEHLTPRLTTIGSGMGWGWGITAVRLTR